MRIGKCFCIACTYIGAIIGAGFATGREIMVYFGDNLLLSAIIAGCFLGILAGLFLWSTSGFEMIKKSQNKKVKFLNYFVKLLLYISTLLTFLCMISACEEIISNTFNIKNVGLWTGIFVAFLGLCDIGIMQKINGVIVPVIMVLLLVLASKSNQPELGKLQIIFALNYCGMNVMTGGYILTEQNAKLNIKEVIFTSILCAVFFVGAIALVYSVSIDYKNFSMPIYEFSKLHKLEYASGIIIYLAIFSTLIGCSKLICQENDNIKVPKILSICMLLCVVVTGINLDFAKSVAIIYPIVGYVGIGYICLAIAVAIMSTIMNLSLKVKKKKKQDNLQNNKQDNSCGVKYLPGNMQT